jgi:hypothetical protein
MSLIESAGNFYLYYKIFGMYIVSILFFIIGSITVYYAKKDKHTKETSISLSDVKCDAQNCNATGNYSVGESTYNIPVQYSAKNTVSHNTVYYDPNNPSDGTINKIPTWFGFIFMGIGSLTLMIAIGFTIFAMNTNSSTRATAGGFLAGMNAISAIAPRH